MSREKQIWEELDSELLIQLRGLYQELSRRMKDKWNRSFPLDDLMCDRWERARQLGFGEGTSIYHNSYVYGDVEVGKNTWIGPFTVLDGSGGPLRIGNNCSIGAGAQIYTHDTSKMIATSYTRSVDQAPVEGGGVSIGDYCVVGAQVVIRRGVRMGEHSIVGACSFVRYSMEPYCIYGGVPARLIGRVGEAKSGGE